MYNKLVDFITLFIFDKEKRALRRKTWKEIKLGDVINKGLAELIAGVIPHKMTRNRWRGIFRFGLIDALRLRNKMKKSGNVKPKHYLSICAIAKNEAPYFEEWIEWHRDLGVEKFYIYDNESTDNIKEVLAPYIKSGLVEYTFWPGMKQQLMAYDHCLAKHRLDSRWIAVIDLDEFINPIVDKDIPSFLKKFEDAAAVEINWLIYGSNGAKTKEPGKVMDRFKAHSLPNHWLNRHVKSIVNPRRVFSFIGCHEVARMDGKTLDTHRNIVTKHFREREPIQDVIRINHYAIKSYEEFLGKKARGRARALTPRNLSYFEEFDLNDIKE